MKTFLSFLAAASGLAVLAYAVETNAWQQRDYADFEEGNLKRLSLRSDGRLSLAPLFTEVLDSSSAYLWALAEDSKGNLYAGGGGPGGPGARVYVRTPDGKTRVLAELDSLEVHALAIDRKDRVYAATSPDGKVYAIHADGKAEVFYDPAAKYIWAMAFDGKGNLFVATGDGGLVHRVSPDGKGTIFFRTEETHARSLALDAKDNLIVGTEPGGLVLRITPAGEGFVLYQAPKAEITAVAVAKDGSVYAAGTGVKRPATVPPAPIPTAPASLVPLTSAVTAAVPTGQTVQPQPALPPSLSAPLPSVAGADVYRIAPDGYARKVWSHPRDLAYAIGFDAGGRPLIGTGNRGVVYRLDSDNLHSALLTAPPTQITGFCVASGGEIYASTGNLGKVYRIGPGIERDGILESDVFDASLFSRWGRISRRGTGNGGAIRFETRSGNLDRPRKDWSPWSAVAMEDDGGPVVSPRARFIQWRLTLSASPDGRSPEVQSIEVAYLPRNAAPVIEQVEITPANYRFPAPSLSVTPSQTITLPPLGGSRKTARPSPAASSSSASMQYAKGEIGARWAASDENGDTLAFKAEIRGVAESEWKLLKDKLRERQVSWDSTAFPDGEYVLRITASDLPDNPPDQALTSTLASDPFVIDNTPPTISGLSAARSGAKLEIRWKAKDHLSILNRAEYSLNGGDWTVVQPAGQLSDSRELDYVLVLDNVSSGEKTIAVRVSDDHDNESVASIVVK